MAASFISYSRLQEAQIDMTQYDAELKLALKANIAQQLYGPNEYEIILNANDQMIQKVRELQSRP